MQLENQKVDVQQIPVQKRVLDIRIMPSGSKYDVLSRQKNLLGDCASPPSPDRDYVSASFSELLKQDTRDGLLIFDPSYYCNIECTFCSLPIHEKFRINWDRIRKHIPLLVLSGMRRAVITGGEPGILPNLTDIISDLRGWGCGFVMLFSHGLWANNEKQLKRVIDAGMSGITISIKAFDDEVAESITRKKLVFSRQLTAIRKIGEYKKSGHLDLLAINHVITRETLDGLRRLDWLDFVPAGALLDLCVVEPYLDETVDEVPAINDLLEVLRNVFAACDERGINYKINGVPNCLLSDANEHNGDRAFMFDDRLRVFVKPNKDKDYMLAHYGYQRLMQYGYRKECKGCTERLSCPGVHKKYDDSWPIKAIG